MVVPLIFAIQRLYVDQRTDRIQAATERLALLKEIEGLRRDIQAMTIQLSLVVHAIGSDNLPNPTKRTATP